MKRNAVTLLFACITLLLSGFPVQSAPTTPVPPQMVSGTRKTGISANEIKLRTTMRNLFIECLGRQRKLAVKRLTDPANSDKAQASLAETLNKIGNIFKTYYGTANGGQITTLYSQYIQLSADYADAVKNGGDKDLVVVKMHARADDIDKFFKSLSPAWSRIKLSEVLRRYSDLSVSEIEMSSKSLGKPDEKIFGATFKKSVEMAEIIVTGIAKQFPDQFRNK